MFAKHLLVAEYMYFSKRRRLRSNNYVPVLLKGEKFKEKTYRTLTLEKKLTIQIIKSISLVSFGLLRYLPYVS